MASVSLQELQEEEDFIQQKHKLKIKPHNNTYNLWKPARKARAKYASLAPYVRIYSTNLL